MNQLASLAKQYLVAAWVMAGAVPGAWASDAQPFRNLDSVIDSLNLRSYYGFSAPGRPLKVAVLDNSFQGYEAEIGKTLPSRTEFHAGPVAADAAAGEGLGQDRHGLAMAQIVSLLMTGNGVAPALAPELHLYDSRGYTNFKAAVEDAVARGVELILYSQVWEYGGNGDGQGFINEVVSKATQAGILWINAAGNFGDTTYTAPITTVDDDWVELGGPNHALEIRCEKNSFATQCPLRLVLSWNDFKSDVEQGTDQDLDLILADDTLDIVQSSKLIQSREPGDRPGYSRYPREIITTAVKPGLYYVRVKNRSQNFNAASRLRITASGDLIAMPRHVKATEETLLNPADHVGVITVGASDSPKSSASALFGKPEISVPSHLVVAEGDFYGTSNSAAIVAGAVGVAKTFRRGLSRADVLEMAQRGGVAPSLPGPGQGLPLAWLGFNPTGQNGSCFMPVRLTPGLPPFLTQALSLGGVLVQSSAGLKIVYDFDPIRVMPGIVRRQANDILATSPVGTRLYPRSSLRNLPPDMIEVLQLPQGTRVCSVDGGGGGTTGGSFRLPGLIR